MIIDPSRRTKGIRMTKRKWDIRLEHDSGFGIDTKTGKVNKNEQQFIRVKYRRNGSKGRFTTFVVCGSMPGDVQGVVDTFEKKRISGSL